MKMGDARVSTRFRAFDYGLLCAKFSERIGPECGKRAPGGHSGAQARGRSGLIEAFRDCLSFCLTAACIMCYKRL